MVLYQTVEDRNNPDYIESNAPFLCDRKDAWLGAGYYFWDTFLENAHWWGKTVYKENGYVVLMFTCDFDAEKCFDLHGNLQHLKDFREIAEEFKKQNLLDRRATVAMVIELLKRETDFGEKFEAIRVYGHYSQKSDTILKIFFSKNRLHKQYLELTPAVQLCLFEKTSLNLRDGEIVYPTRYISDYVL